LDVALAYAHAHGTVVVVGAGNTARNSVEYPASALHVIAVGATTDSGCLASYSDYGHGLDLVAPGGGGDAYVGDDSRCHVGRHGASIYQITRSLRPLLGFDTVGYVGTSMAAPHVSATAGLVIASRVIGTHPSPSAVERRLEQTARDLGPRGRDNVYGWGLVDAGAATSPRASHSS
jgi:serine protease